MIVAEYTGADLERIKTLHRQSRFEYALPDLSDASVFSRHVVRDGTDIAMAAFLKLSAEAYLVCDPSWRNPAWRMEALRQLQEAGRIDAERQGIASVHAFPAKEVEKHFGRRLQRLGWKLVDSDCYVSEVKGG